MKTAYGLASFGLFVKYGGPFFRRKAPPIRIQIEVVRVTAGSYMADGYGFGPRAGSLVAHWRLPAFGNMDEILLLSGPSAASEMPKTCSGE